MSYPMTIKNARKNKEKIIKKIAKRRKEKVVKKIKSAYVTRANRFNGPKNSDKDPHWAFGVDALRLQALMCVFCGDYREGTYRSNPRNIQWISEMDCKVKCKCFHHFEKVARDVSKNKENKLHEPFYEEGNSHKEVPLSQGANKNIQNNHYVSLLSAAAKYGRKEIGAPNTMNEDETEKTRTNKDPIGDSIIQIMTLSIQALQAETDKPIDYGDFRRWMG